MRPTLLALLRGTVPTVCEYREDQLTATWSEMKGEERFYTAFYLSPFDPGDWQTWPGEKWRLERTVRRVLFHESESVEKRVVEVTGHSPLPDWCVNFLSKDRATLPPTLRWTALEGAYFVFPVPIDFRTVPHDRREINLFRNASKTGQIWAHLAYEDDPIGPKTGSSGPFPPYDFVPGNVLKLDGGWERSNYLLKFTDGEFRIFASIAVDESLSGEGSLKRLMEEFLPLSQLQIPDFK